MRHTRKAFGGKSGERSREAARSLADASSGRARGRTVVTGRGSCTPHPRRERCESSRYRKLQPKLKRRQGVQEGRSAEAAGMTRSRPCPLKPCREAPSRHDTHLRHFVVLNSGPVKYEHTIEIQYISTYLEYKVLN